MIVKAGMKAYTTKRNAENIRYRNMANRGMLLEQEVIKKARYRQVR